MKIFENTRGEGGEGKKNAMNASCFVGLIFYPTFNHKNDAPLKTFVVKAILFYVYNIENVKIFSCSPIRRVYKVEGKDTQSCPVRCGKLELEYSVYDYAI